MMFHSDGQRRKYAVTVGQQKEDLAMTRMFKAARISAVVVALGMMFGAAPASATVIVSTINFSFGTGSAGTTFLTATFDDQNTAGSVILTIDVSTLAVGSRGLSFFFNYTGNPSDLTDTGGGFSYVFAGTADAPKNVTNIFDDTAICCQADGDGFYDIEFNWTGNKKFLQSNTFTATITFAGLVATDFIDTSVAGPQGAFCTAAHIADAGGKDTESDHLGGSCRETEIPEPSTLLLFGTGLIGLGVLARRRRTTAA